MFKTTARLAAVTFTAGALALVGAASAGSAGAATTANPNGTEDWSWVHIATVPHHGAGAFGFTGFDNTNFGGKPVYELEYTPSGVDTQLCLTISSRYRSNGAVLGNCISAAQQAFIVTQTAPGLESLVHPPSPVAATGLCQYALDVSQNLTDAQHHLALLAPHAKIRGELVAAGSPVHVA